MSRTLRVALVQMRSGIDPVANRAAAEDFIREAAMGGARFVLTPEMTTRLDRDKARFKAGVSSHDHEAEGKAWGRMAREHGIWLLLGSTAVPASDGRAYNRSMLFDPKGQTRAIYDKIHLFDVALGSGETYRESEGMAPGGSAVLCDGPLEAKIGLTICYDIRFPTLYRRLAQAGAEILTVPAAFTVPTGEAHWETLLRARAIETGCFVLAPAQGGQHEDGRRTYGRSMIVDPWGKIIAAHPDDSPGLVTADLPLELVNEARAKIPAWSLNAEYQGP